MNAADKPEDQTSVLPHELALLDALQAAISAVLMAPPGPTLDDLADALCSLSAATERLAKQRAAAAGLGDSDSDSDGHCDWATRARQLANAARSAYLFARRKALGQPGPELENILTRLATQTGISVPAGGACRLA